MKHIKVIAHPRAKNQKIVEDAAGILHVYVSEPAIDGKANTAVIASLAKHLSVAKSFIVFEKGQKSKIKTFTIHDKK
jgi:uncharacterized protein